VDAAYIEWGKPGQKSIAAAHPDEMDKLGFAAGSMGPKVQAACEFARNTGSTAVIGSLENIEAIVQGSSGTRISLDTEGIIFR
jgi:carbamate kinase